MWVSDVLVSVTPEKVATPEVEVTGFVLAVIPEATVVVHASE